MAHSQPVSGNTVSGKITQLLVHTKDWENRDKPGPKLFFISMSELPPVPVVGGYARVAVPDTHPAFSDIVLMATEALASRMSIELTYFETTYTRTNSWDFGTLAVKS